MIDPVFRQFLSTKIYLYLVLPLIATVVSISITGFVFGYNNNIFHIPYVLDYGSLPQFQDDFLYQSLKHFTSIVWPLLRHITNESNIYIVFELAHYMSRFLAFVGAIYLISSTKLLSSLGCTIAIACISVSPLLIGYSYIGGHGMFINYFTHTEVTWGLLLFTIGTLLQERFIIAAGLAGLTFAINALVGTWLLFAIIAVLVFTKTNISLKKLFFSGLSYTIFASPVVIWILFTFHGKNSSTEFSYIEYIRDYFPNHFLIEEANLTLSIKVALTYACGFMAALHTPYKQFIVTLLSAFAFIFILGVPLPYLFDERIIFNLHLLRSDGLTQMLAVVLSTIVGSKLLIEERKPSSNISGAVILLSVAVPGGPAYTTIFCMLTANYLNSRNKDYKYFFSNKYLHYTQIVLALLTLFYITKEFDKIDNAIVIGELIIVGLLFLIAFKSTDLRIKIRKSLTAGLVLALGLLVVFKQAPEKITVKPSQKTQNENWAELITWVRNQGLDGEYLVPSSLSHRFQLLTRKKVWVDWKQGGAVMWAPEFHKKWHSRIKKLKEAERKGTYIDLANTHKIDFIVITKPSPCPDNRATLYSNNSYQVCGALLATSHQHNP